MGQLIQISMQDENFNGSKIMVVHNSNHMSKRKIKQRSENNFPNNCRIHICRINLRNVSY